MALFSEVIDQADAVDQLVAVLKNQKRMVNTWMFTGPPGSGRFNIAQIFAKILLSLNDIGGKDVAKVDLASHPDYKLITSSTLSIKVDDVRESIALAATYPNVAKYRIFLIKNADSLTETAQNALLKAIEEPNATTIWILLAPSSESVLPTIKSRTRIIHLKTPSTASIANLLIREGVEASRSKLATKLSNGHIGIARQLSTSDIKLDQRISAISQVLNINTVAEAVIATEEILSNIKSQYEDDISQKFVTLTNSLRQQLGLGEKDVIGKSQRAQFKALDDEKALNLKRALRDYVDLLLQDVLLAYRDIALIQLKADIELITNTPLLRQLQTIGKSQTLQDTIYKFNYINQSRMRIRQNASIELALIALMTKLLIPQQVRHG